MGEITKDTYDRLIADRVFKLNGEESDYRPAEGQPQPHARGAVDDPRGATETTVRALGSDGAIRFVCSKSL